MVAQVERWGILCLPSKTLFPFEAVGLNTALVVDDAGRALSRGTWWREGCHLPGFALVCGCVHPNACLLFHSEIGYGAGAVVR